MSAALSKSPKLLIEDKLLLIYRLLTGNINILTAIPVTDNR